MILLRPVLALFAAASSSNIDKRQETWPVRVSSSSSSDVADAAPFEPIRDTCLEDFRREQEDTKPKAGAVSKDPSSASSFLSSFSTIRNAAGSAGQQQQQQQDQVIYRVCLSPGCVADGALKTYEQLLALAPPHVIVEPGSCHSLCGNGPVIDTTTTVKSTTTTSSSSPNNNNKRMRKVSGPKVLQLLQDEGVIPELAEGYALVLKGDVAFAAQQYSHAIELYEKAVQMAFRPAMEAQAAREHLARIAPNSSRGPTTAAPRSASSSARGAGGGGSTLPTSSLDWLVRARRNTATSLLHLGDLEAALLEAQAACNLSRNTCWRCFVVVAECYRHKGNTQSEYGTLKALFALPVDEAALDFPSKNDRRELQFRMQRLAKDLQQ
jgi:tetratricopeptide (TPR) repeat protein